jgi:hypothetical protein
LITDVLQFRLHPYAIIIINGRSPGRSVPRVQSIDNGHQSVVDEAVEDGVGERWIADHVVPVIDGHLAGDDGGSRPRHSVRFQHFPQKIRQRFHQPFDVLDWRNLKILAL